MVICEEREESIPLDCVAGMKLLADPVLREAAKVDKNKYLFASTGQSANHVEGWYCIGHLCVAAGVAEPSLLTATLQRHRISTMYAALDLTQGEREAFYSHMGHTQAVNEGSYQLPLAVRNLVTVGCHLHQFDKGILNCFNKYE